MAYFILIAMLTSVIPVFIPVSQVFAQTSYTTEVQVIDSEKKALKKIARDHPEYIVDHVSSTGFELYGDSNLEPYLITNNILYYVPAKELGLLGYPTPEQINQKLLTLKQQYPSLISIIEIGKSVNQRPLLVAKLTAKPNDTSLPEFKYVANMHGDEIAGRELMVLLIEDLLKGYSQDSRIRRLMDTVHIYVMPSMNPDGAAAKSRFNASGVDLNRTFPDFTTTDRSQSTMGRAPEVQAMMRFQAAHRFKLSANFHGGAEVVNYPWDTADTLFPLDNLVRLISMNYSKRVPYIYQSTEF